MIYTLLERNAFDSIAFFSQCNSYSPNKFIQDGKSNKIYKKNMIKYQYIQK